MDTVLSNFIVMLHLSADLGTMTSHASSVFCFPSLLERGEMDSPNVFITAELFIYLRFFRAFEVFLLVMGSKITIIGSGENIYIYINIYILVHLFATIRTDFLMSGFTRWFKYDRD